MQRSGQSGVTIIELMIVLVIVGILAAIAVPAYMKSKNKAKTSEVAAVFAEFGVRQQQYYNEKGEYLSMAGGEGAFYPDVSGLTATSAQEWRSGVPSEWRQLRITIDKEGLYCSYVTVAGPAGGGSVGGLGASFGMTQDQDWYYVLAQCNLDESANDPANNSLFFTSSVNNTLQVRNEGR